MKTRFRFHSYNYPDGQSVHGHLSINVLESQYKRLGNIDFNNKTVLDIGCWDGFYSIKAKQAGAKNVLGIDIDPWNKPDWQSNFTDAVNAFNLDNNEIRCEKKNLFELKAEDKRDIVLFMGVLYHLQNPLEALYKLREVTGELLVVETLVDGNDLPFPALKFYPGKEMNNDPTNWFGPNKLWIESALKVAGFTEVTLINEYDNRAVYHAK